MRPIGIDHTKLKPGLKVRLVPTRFAGALVSRRIATNGPEFIFDHESRDVPLMGYRRSGWFVSVKTGNGMWLPFNEINFE
jgi:hypothetical protein